MNFEDRFRSMMQQAGAEMPWAVLDPAATFARARRGRVLHLVGISFAAAALLVAGVIAASALVRSDTSGSTPPAGSRSARPSPSPSPSPSTDDCSAAGDTPPTAEQRGLPQAVVDMRSQLAQAALACDYAALEDLALAGDGAFQFSYGQGRRDSPGEFWRGLEDAPRGRGHDPVMHRLVRLLATPYATQTQSVVPNGPRVTVYIWPALALEDAPSEQDWQALVEAGAYSQEEVDRMKRDADSVGIGYLGYRLAIAADGNWTYLVAGD